MTDASGGTGAARRPLTAAERLVCTAAAVMVGSMLLPWYGIALSGGLSVSGFDEFGFAAAALMITAGAAVVVVVREAAGRPSARPLRSAELVILAGAWAALVVVSLMIDRPDELAGSRQITLRIGPFVALGACAAMVVAGIRMRATADG